MPCGATQPKHRNSRESSMHVAFSRTKHRPWPVPKHAWTWRQSWKDLLFAHWPIPGDLLEPLVPKGLSVQQFDGTSWIGVVPFRMTLLHFSRGVDVVVWSLERLAPSLVG